MVAPVHRKAAGAFISTSVGAQSARDPPGKSESLWLPASALANIPAWRAYASGQADPLCRTYRQHRQSVADFSDDLVRDRVAERQPR